MVAAFCQLFCHSSRSICLTSSQLPLVGPSSGLAAHNRKVNQLVSRRTPACQHRRSYRRPRELPRRSRRKRTEKFFRRGTSALSDSQNQITSTLHPRCARCCPRAFCTFRKCGMGLYWDGEAEFSIIDRNSRCQLIRLVSIPFFDNIRDDHRILWSLIRRWMVSDQATDVLTLTRLSIE